MLTSERAQVVADHVRGTAMSLTAALEQLGYDDGLADDPAFSDALDGHVFECESCGWWCGNDELATNTDASFICDDCTPAEEDDE